VQSRVSLSLSMGESDFGLVRWFLSERRHCGVPLSNVGAGFLEFFGGIVMGLGLFTRWVAFILSGEMAVTFFTAHFPQGWNPMLNGEKQRCSSVLCIYTSGQQGRVRLVWTGYWAEIESLRDCCCRWRMQRAAGGGEPVQDRIRRRGRDCRTPPAARRRPVVLDSFRPAPSKRPGGKNERAARPTGALFAIAQPRSLSAYRRRLFRAEEVVRRVSARHTQGELRCRWPVDSCSRRRCVQQIYSRRSTARIERRESRLGRKGGAVYRQSRLFPAPGHLQDPQPHCWQLSPWSGDALQVRFEG
jgi:hypothetical protein